MTRAALRSLVSVSRRSADGQPTVSRRIALLEREFGCLFLDRQSRGVKPTREGWVLLTHAVSILEAIDAAERDLMKLGRDKNRANATKARKRVREKRTAPKAE